MSRQPPGGTSTICFGTDDSPFRKSAPATPGSPPKSRIASALAGIQPGEALTPAHKQQIYGIVQDAEDVEDLVCKLADVLASPLPPASAGINGSHGSALNGGRGFKPPALKVDSAIANFRDALKRRGVDSLARLAKKFKIMDDDNSRTLCYDELKKGMLESGCQLEESEMQALFRFLDADCTGDVNIDEFFIGVRGEMSTRRMALVMDAFDKLDVNSDGALTVNDLASNYDCSRHPDVVAGIATEVEVLQNFLAGFDGTMGPPTKIITPEKFATYYAGVSCSIDDDDYFELMIRNVWHIPGGEGESEDTACRRLLVTHDDGSQSIETLAEDITVSKEDLQEMKRRLVAQGVPVVKISLYGDLTGADAVPTTSSPTKKAAPIVDREEDGVIASAYKQRMASSNVTF